MAPATQATLAAPAAHGLPAANPARAAADHLGHLAVRVGSQARVARGRAAGRAANLEVTHLLRQAHGIHLEVVTLNHPTPNHHTRVVVVPKMMASTLVDMEANGTRGRLRRDRGHLLVASRVRAEEVAHQVVVGDHRRVNLASLGTEI